MAKGGSSSGGGGSHGSGRVEYPPYMTNLHAYLLWGNDLSGSQLPFNRLPSPTSIIGVLNNTLQGNIDRNAPYYSIISNLGTTVAIPNPDSFLGSSTGLDLPTKRTAVTTAIDRLSDTTDLDLFQDSLEQATEDGWRRGLNQFASAAVMNHATDGSAFIWGLSNLTHQRQRILAQERAQAALQDRYTAIEARARDFTLDLEWGKAMLVGKVDEVEQHVQMFVNNQLWDLSLFNDAANMLASASGAVSSRGSDSSARMRNALAGALTGAGLGAGAFLLGGGKASALFSAASGGPTLMGVGLLAGTVLGLL